MSKMLPSISVIGIGGGGINAVNHMIDCGMQGVKFIAVSSYSHILRFAKAQNRVDIGATLPKGLGMLNYS